MLPSPPDDVLAPPVLPSAPTPGIPAANVLTADVTGASAPLSGPVNAPVNAPPGVPVPADGAVGDTSVDRPLVSVPTVLTVLPSVDTSALPLPAELIVRPSLPSALPSVVSAAPTGVPRPVAVASVCVAEVSVEVSGTMAVMVVVVTCSTGPVSVATGVLPADPLLPDDAPLPSLDHVGELDAVIDGLDCESLPPPSDVPMSPLPEFAQPASTASDAADSAHCKNIRGLGGFDFNKNARSRILCLHCSERLCWTPSVLRSLFVG